MTGIMGNGVAGDAEPRLHGAVEQQLLQGEVTERGLTSSPSRDGDKTSRVSSPQSHPFASAGDNASFRSSVPSSLSSSSSLRSDVESYYGDGMYPQTACEWEEIPSFRWIASPLRWWKPRCSESSATTTTTTTTISSNSRFSSSVGGSSVEQYSTTSKSAAEGDPQREAILGTPNLRVFTFAELKSATKNFRPETVLGEGRFGRVFKGWVDERTLNPAKSGSGMAVAVKKLNPESMQGLEEWQSAVNFLGSLRHPNLVRLLGYCLEDQERLLVYEFMAKGSWENHLFKRGVFQPLTWSLRLKILIDAARGLAFLHDSDRKVIHRDFKTSKILLDSHYNAKISVFGLAKNGPMGGDSHVTTQVMGTYGYAAPEYVATGHLYVKSDVYGFGVVLLEMLSGQRVLDTNRPSGQHNLVEWAKPRLTDKRKLYQVMDQRLDGEYPPEAALQAAKLTLRCLASEPKGRPSMKEVAEGLQEIEAMGGAADARPPPPVAGRAAARGTAALALKKQPGPRHITLPG